MCDGVCVCVCVFLWGGGLGVWGGGGIFVALVRFNAHTCMYSFTTNYDCFLWAKSSGGQMERKTNDYYNYNINRYSVSGSEGSDAENSFYN